jgi:hypothetical protein
MELSMVLTKGPDWQLQGPNPENLEVFARIAAI